MDLSTQGFVLLLTTAPLLALAYIGYQMKRIGDVLEELRDSTDGRPGTR